jgi:hypothetical protein
MLQLFLIRLLLQLLCRIMLIPYIGLRLKHSWQTWQNNRGWLINTRLPRSQRGFSRGQNVRSDRLSRNRRRSSGPVLLLLLLRSPRLWSARLRGGSGCRSCSRIDTVVRLVRTAAAATLMLLVLVLTMTVWARQRPPRTRTGSCSGGSGASCGVGDGKRRWMGVLLVGPRRRLLRVRVLLLLLLLLLLLKDRQSAWRRRW